MKIVKNLRQGEVHYIVKMCGCCYNGEYSYSAQEFTETEFEKAKYVLLDIKNLIEDCNGDIYDLISEIFNKYDYKVDYPYGKNYSIRTLEELKIEYMDSEGRIYDIELIE